MAAVGMDFAWNIGDRFDADRFVATSPERAASRFRARKTNLIFNDVRLEGSSFTEPEVQTLLDGVTVDAKTTFEVDQVLNLSEAADLMIQQAMTGPVLRAVTYAAFSARNQFYFDGNKRTSRYMMNGHLIAHGYDGIVTPESRKADYNLSLVALFMDADARPYIEFTLSCYDDPRGAR